MEIKSCSSEAPVVVPPKELTLEEMLKKEGIYKLQRSYTVRFIVIGHEGLCLVKSSKALEAIIKPMWAHDKFVKTDESLYLTIK